MSMIRNILIEKSLCLRILMLIPALSCWQVANAVTRTYYIAADEVLWDYAPAFPTNTISGHAFSEGQRVFVEGNGEDRIGRAYIKAQYVEYTDATFSTVKPRPVEWEHLGILGPAILADVGDTLEIVFKNQTGKYVSMHPHGVFYAKDSEGALYDDGTSGVDKLDDAVSPGGTTPMSGKCRIAQAPRAGRRIR